MALHSINGRYFEYEPFTEIGEAIVLDLATSGLDPLCNRIVRFVGMQVDFNKIQSNEPQRFLMLDRYIHAEYVPATAVAIHGLTAQMLSGCPEFAEVAHGIREFIGERTIITHNAEFDTRFLDKELVEVGERGIEGNRILCTQRRYWHLRDTFQDSDVSSMAEAMNMAPVARRDMSQVVKTVARIAYNFYKFDSKLC